MRFNNNDMEFLNNMINSKTMEIISYIENCLYGRDDFKLDDPVILDGLMLDNDDTVLVVIKHEKNKYVVTFPKRFYCQSVYEYDDTIDNVSYIIL